eukprot:6971764-Alexandrium_andersonii.AAC.1
MSASLVGSEMCIRDRGIPALGVGGAEAFRAAREHRRVHLQERPDRPHAVSYTHLTLPTICSV